MVIDHTSEGSSLLPQEGNNHVSLTFGHLPLVEDMSQTLYKLCVALAMSGMEGEVFYLYNLRSYTMWVQTQGILKAWHSFTLWNKPVSTY